eukprot:650786-Prymnesium_polylepis.1
MPSCFCAPPAPIRKPVTISSNTRPMPHSSQMSRKMRRKSTGCTSGLRFWTDSQKTAATCWAWHAIHRSDASS